MRLILGGPGCGKTTRLLNIMEELVSFTKKAVGEAARISVGLRAQV